MVIGIGIGVGIVLIGIGVGIGIVMTIPHIYVHLILIQEVSHRKLKPFVAVFKVTNKVRNTAI